MNKIQRLINEYNISGISFSLFYFVSTMVIPNILLYERIKPTKTYSLIIWFSILLLWQLMIIYSIWKYLNNKGSEIDTITYDLFVKGGWYNFQRWIQYYAEDIFEDIIFVGLILTLPLGYLNKTDHNKLLLVFSKIGIFLLFTYFVLGPPKYNIQKGDINLNNYLNMVFEFEGDYKKDGYIDYISKNKSTIIKLIFVVILLITIIK